MSLEKIILILVIVILLLVILLLIPKVLETYKKSENTKNTVRNGYDLLKETEQHRLEKELEEQERKNWKPSRGKLYLSPLDLDYKKDS